MTGQEIAHTVHVRAASEKRLFGFPLLRHETITLGPEKYTLIIATQEPETIEGLSYIERQNLGDNTGMLLVYPDEQTPSISMQFVLFDLDILYLDANGKIKSIVAERQYDAPLPPTKAHYILEIPQGEADRLKLKVLDVIKLPADLKDLKPSAPENFTPAKLSDPGSAPAIPKNNG